MHPHARIASRRRIATAPNNMATPREEEAARYLRDHRIDDLLHSLTSMLFFHRPERPREFLIEQLELLKASRRGEAPCPCLFDAPSLDVLFGILDPTGRGHISAAQYRAALTTLGVKDFDESPEGASTDQISRETFKTEAREGLLKSSTTFKAL
nr:EF-hand calcium-binding domain-containing protein 10-like [Paramormyrops kingsleyae]